MKRLRLDLKAPEGKAAFLRLAAGADVVLESFRPGVVDRLGIGYDDVAAVNPDIIYCSTSGYGQTGPASQWAGHDINYLGVGGYLDCSERAPGDKPPLPGATVADAAGGGMQAAMAIMAALVRRASTGEGSFLDVSIADGVLALMSLYIDEYLATGVVPGPGHYILTGRYACYDTYRCADGQWVAVGAIEPAFYRNLCRLLDCEQWADHQLDDDVQDEIRAAFRAAFARRTRDDWVAELAPGRHLRRPGLLRARAGRRPAVRRPRPHRRGRPRHPGPVPPARHRCWPAPTPTRRAVPRCATRPSPTPTSSWPPPGSPPTRSPPCGKEASSHDHDRRGEPRRAPRRHQPR